MTHIIRHLARVRPVLGVCFLGGALMAACQETPSQGQPSDSLIDTGLGTTDVVSDESTGDSPTSSESSLDSETWNRVKDGPPFGAAVMDVMVADNTLYALTHSHLWARERQSPWRFIGRLPTRSFGTVQPRMVQLGDQFWFSSGINAWRSTDAGASWLEVDTQVNCLTTHGDDLYALAVEDTLRWDEDLADWRVWKTSLWSSFDADDHSLIATQTRLLREVNRAVPGRHLAVLDLTDSDPQWTLSTAPEFAGRSSTLKQDHGAMAGLWAFALAIESEELDFSQFELLRSEDGIGWSKLPAVPEEIKEAFHPVGVSLAKADTTYLSMDAELPIYALEDETWKPISMTGLDLRAWYRRIFTWDESLFVSDRYGVFENIGTGWVDFNDGLYEANPVAATQDFIFSWHAERAYRKQLPDGEWELVPKVRDACPLGAEDVQGTTMVCERYSPGTNGVYSVSFDQGETFADLEVPWDLSGTSVKILPSGVLFLAGDQGYLWDKGKLAWTELKGPSEFVSPSWMGQDGAFIVTEMDFDSKFQGQHRIASLPDMTWRETKMPSSAGFITGMLRNSDDVWVWTRDGDDEDGGDLFLSTDLGQSWVEEAIPLKETDHIIGLWRWQDTLVSVVKTGNSLVLQRRNSGQWEPFDEIEGVTFHSLVAARDRLFLTTEAHGWFAWEASK